MGGPPLFKGVMSWSSVDALSELCSLFSLFNVEIEPKVFAQTRN